MSWTQKMVDHLTTRWREQTSATELAHELSGMAGRAVTRNAVLGKVHRLGLMGQGAKPCHTRPERDKSEQASARAAKAKAEARAASAAAFAADCRPGSSYCRAHHRLAYRPMVARKPGEKKRVAA